MVNREKIMSTNNVERRNKMISFTAALVMVFTMFAIASVLHTDKVYATGETAKVTADVLNVRTGAGTSYKIVGTLKKGKTFTVKGSANDKKGVKWYKLTYSGKTRYVSSKHVNIIKYSVTSVTNTKGTVTSGPLNVRKGPGTGYSKLGSLSKGKTFTVTGKTKDINGKVWYRLTYSGKTGFVHSAYVKTSSSSSSSSSSS